MLAYPTTNELPGLLPCLTPPERAELDQLLATTARPPRPEFRGAALALQSCRLPEFVISGPSETGKTLAALYALDALAREYRGSQWAIVRKVRADMDGTVLQLFKQHFAREEYGVTPFGGEHAEFFDYAESGARIWTGGMDRPGKVLSGARDGIYVNQAEELELEDWETLSTRTTGRAGVLKPGLLFGDCNPGGPQHWILKRARLKLFNSRHEDNPLLHDGVGWTEQGRRTLETLGALTGVRRARLFEGKWVQAEGVVYDNFDTDNLTDADPDPAAPIELAADDGYVDPRVILFIQRTATEILVFDEIYESRKLAEEHVREAVLRTIRWRNAEPPEGARAMALPDLARWCREQGVELPEMCIGPDESKELQARFRLADIPYRGGTQRPLTLGIPIVRRLICDANGARTLTVHRRCVNLINELTDGYKYPPVGSRKDDEVPLDADNHACLVAGTTVKTKAGDVRIEAIAPGDEVLTRAGWRRVIAATMTSARARVKRVVFSDGNALIGTGNHPLFVSGRGFIPIDALRYGDRMVTTDAIQELSPCVSQREPSRLSSTKASNSGAIQTRSGGLIGSITVLVRTLLLGVSRLCTAKFGKTTSGRSRRAIMFTTKTGTRRTTTRPIWNVFPAQSISLITADTSARSIKKSAPSTWTKCVIWRLSGMVRGPGWPGIEPTASEFGRIASPLSAFATSAGASFRVSMPSQALAFARTIANRPGVASREWTTRSGVALNAAAFSRSTSTRKTNTVPVSVLRVEDVPDPHPVYNLTVEGEHEFFANGVLTHNCDALRYWCGRRARR